MDFGGMSRVVGMAAVLAVVGSFHAYAHGEVEPKARNAIEPKARNAIEPKARNVIDQNMRFVQIEALTKQERSKIANLGVSIEATRSDSVWGFANGNSMRKLRRAGFKVLGDFEAAVGRGGHQHAFDFPVSDSKYHNYQEMISYLNELVAAHSDVTTLSTFGKSIEGRDLYALHINTSPDALKSGQSNKPGVVFMGNHHAREHLSLEVPLMLAKYLLEQRKDPQIAQLIDSRDIWVLPMINPDGVEFDIGTGSYKYWRKNRRATGGKAHGVDLNRNYGYKWGTGGSSGDPGSETYKGLEPFSEPETQAVKKFIEAHLNTKVLLTFHTFSELVLYPWGHSYDPIANDRDRQVFETMAKTMAGWNGYTPEQSSDLYIASGDTTDWAYGTHGIFAFTFELSPKDMWSGGGFYPGDEIIEKVFQDNLKPCLYMLEVADNPHKVIEGRPSGWLSSYVEPRIPADFVWDQRTLGRVER